MNTKNTLKTLVLALLFVSACSKNEIAPVGNADEKGYTLPVTVSVTRQDDEAPKATYNETSQKLEFSAGDQLFVNGTHASAGKFAGTLDYDAVSGKFSGSITTQNEYSGTADALFKAAASIEATLLPDGYESTGFLTILGDSYPYNDICLVFNTNAFAITKAAAVEQLSCERTASYSGGFALSPYFAILNFTITDLEASTEVAVVFSDGYDVVNNKVTTDASGNAAFAVGVLGAYTDFADCSLTVGGSAITLASSSVSLAKGKIYNVNRSAAAAVYTRLSDATPSDHGKVVCAAGHLHDAKTALPEGCTAVGILGKVTSTGHGLILALEDATNQTWDTVNGWTSVITYAGTTLKKLPDDAARGANLTSLTTLGITTVSDWCVAQKSDYEAIFENLDSTTGNSDGKTFDAHVNAFITTGAGGTAIEGDHWSATAITVSEISFGWNCGSENWSMAGKTVSKRIRPVLGF